MTAPADYLSSLEDWKARRLARLTAPDGWLTIVGRFWLDKGATATVGSAPDSDIVLPVGPARLGTIGEADDGSLSFVPADGSAPTRIVPDKANPPRFMVGALQLEVTTVNGEHALRVRDTQSPEPARFPGIDYFQPRPELRIVADWVPFGDTLTVNTTHDILTDVVASHKAVFELDGQRIELIATHGTPEAPQFVIRDLTSRDSTYPACRFIYGEEVTDKTIVVDFNKAFNPPCAFTEHAVCPLPPPQNVLPFRIEAGEKRVEGYPPSH